MEMTGSPFDLRMRGARGWPRIRSCNLRAPVSGALRMQWRVWLAGHAVVVPGTRSEPSTNSSAPVNNAYTPISHASASAPAPMQPRCCDQIEYAGDNRVCADDGDQHDRGNASIHQARPSSSSMWDSRLYRQVMNFSLGSTHLRFFRVSAMRFAILRSFRTRTDWYPRGTKITPVYRRFFIAAHRDAS